MEKSIINATAEETPREIYFPAFIDAYKETKPEVEKLTLDKNKYLRIADAKGNEMQVFEFSTDDGIQQFFDLAHEMMKVE